MKTKTEIEKDFEMFIDEIDDCSSKKEAQDILKRYREYCAENNIPADDNYLVESGFSEALLMLADNGSD